MSRQIITEGTIIKGGLNTTIINQKPNVVPPKLPTNYSQKK